MTPDKPTFSTEELKRELREQAKTEKEDFSKVLEKMDILLKTYEHGQGSERKLRLMHNEELVKAEAQILKMKEENQALTMEFLKARYQEKLAKIKQRFALALEISGKDNKEVSNFDELANLNQIDMPLLMRDLQNDAKDVPTSYLEVVRKLEAKPKEKLNPAEKELVTSEIRKIASMKAQPKANEVRKNLGKYAGLAILSHMKSEDRVSIMRELLDEQKTLKIIIATCASNYLTIEQSTELVKEMAKKHPEWSENCMKTMKLLENDKFKSFKVQVENLQGSAKEALRRNFGKNYAGKILSLKGAFVWEVGRGWGMATMAANFLANVDVTNVVKNPAKFAEETGKLLVNPAFTGAASAVAASVEVISGGAGNGLITQTLARLVYDNKEELKQGKEKAHDFMKQTLGDNRRAAELYFRNAKDIVKQFEKDPKKLDLDTLGINYDALDKNFKDKSLGGMTKEEYNEILPQLALGFYDNTIGLGMKTADLQEKFINEARDKAGLNKFEL